MVQTQKRIYDEIHRELQCWIDDFYPIAGAQGFKHLADQYGFDRLLEVCYEEYRYYPQYILRKLFGADFLNVSHKQIQHLGLVFDRESPGYDSHFLVTLVQGIKSMGHEVTVIDARYLQSDVSDQLGLTFDFSLSNFNFIKRFSEISELCKKGILDGILYCSSDSEFFGFDIISFKLQHIPVLAYRSFPFINSLASGDFFKFSLEFEVLRHTNLLLCASKIDVEYYKMLGINAAYAPVPIIPLKSKILKNSESSVNNSMTLLWIGTFDSTTQNQEVVEIFGLVKDQVPNVRLLLVVRSIDNEYLSIYNRFVALGLQNYVEFVVNPEKIDDLLLSVRAVFLTERFMTNPTLMFQLMRSGLPIAQFKLSEKIYGYDNFLEEPGIICSTVPHFQYPEVGYRSVSQNLVKLVTDSVYWDRMSKSQRNNFQLLQNIQFDKIWLKALRELKVSHDRTGIIQDSMLQDFFNTLNSGARMISEASGNLGRLQERNELMRNEIWQRVDFSNRLFWTKLSLQNSQAKQKQLEADLKKNIGNTKTNSVRRKFKRSLHAAKRFLTSVNPSKFKSNSNKESNAS